MFRTIVLLLATLAVPVVAAADHAKGHTRFTVRIENVSTPQTLKSATGETAPAPNSPGLWLVFRGKAPLFVPGKLDAGKGLEAQAEDGNPTMLAQSLSGLESVGASGVFNVPVGDKEPGPALPGKAYEFTVDAVPGQRLMLATMFGQSNDLFYAPEAKGIALFDGKGRPLSGDVTSQLVLWDAGTEQNEEPGFGPHQAPRQKSPNTGAAERERVSRVKDGYVYPSVAQVLRVTISPAGVAAR